MGDWMHDPSLVDQLGVSPSTLPRSSKDVDPWFETAGCARPCHECSSQQPTCESITRFRADSSRRQRQRLRDKAIGRAPRR